LRSQHLQLLVGSLLNAIILPPNPKTLSHLLEGQCSARLPLLESHQPPAGVLGNKQPFAHSCFA
jgi:hypothetical protein